MNNGLNNWSSKFLEEGWLEYDDLPKSNHRTYGPFGPAHGFRRSGHAKAPATNAGFEGDWLEGFIEIARKTSSL